MDPPFRKLATMVEPDGDRIRASPPDMRPDGRRILCCDETDDLAVSPREQLGHEARAEPPSSMDPFHLQIIEPLDEPGLIDVGRRGSAARLVSLPRQQTEISTNEVDREAKHIPAWTCGRTAPIRRLEGSAGPRAAALVQREIAERTTSAPSSVLTCRQSCSPTTSQRARSSRIPSTPRCRAALLRLESRRVFCCRVLSRPRSRGTLAVMRRPVRLRSLFDAGLPTVRQRHAGASVGLVERCVAPWSSQSEGGSCSAAGHPCADWGASVVGSGHDQTGSSRSSTSTRRACRSRARVWWCPTKFTRRRAPGSGSRRRAVRSRGA
jgi:hypothetical protein